MPMVNDYFDISVGDEGLTSLYTNDNAAAAAHINIIPDGMLLVHSGGGVTSPDESAYTDTNFFVSGTIGSMSSSIKGTSVFGGDMMVSGTLVANGSGRWRLSCYKDRQRLHRNHVTLAAYSQSSTTRPD